MPCYQLHLGLAGVEVDSIDGGMARRSDVVAKGHCKSAEFGLDIAQDD